ncbi:MAG: thioredoxin domain-containing protein [Chloroflexi bacterium]|nr:thioredoxin domain-containing protein [Chloroflexota bacterium]
MRRLSLTVAVVLAAVFVSASVYAQGDDPLAFYDGIETSRADDGGFVLGSLDAPIAVVVFADFMCPHCQTYVETTHEFIDAFVRTGQARLEYRLYPIVHPTYSALTAQLAECAEVQRDGAFWPAHDVLYSLAGEGQIGPNTSEALAEALDLDVAKLDTCAADASQYITDLDLGTALGVSGTPATAVRLEDGTLGWAYLRDQIFNRGGLPISLLTEIVEAEDVSSVVIVPSPLLASLVTDSGCANPCWQGITPGQTLLIDALDIIRDDRQHVEITETSTGDADALTWRRFDSRLNEPNYIIANAAGEVDIISLIDVSDYGLGDVVDNLGDPSLALGFSTDDGSAVLYIIYPDIATIVIVLTAPDDGLSEESLVVGAQYFSDDAMALLLEDAGAAEWTGYDGLDDYIR